MIKNILQASLEGQGPVYLVLVNRLEEFYKDIYSQVQIQLW